MDLSELPYNDFSDYIRAYVSCRADDPEFDWTPRREWWVGKVDELVDAIESWLAPVITDGTVTFTREPIIVDEGSMGSYAVTQAHIGLGKEKVTLIPVATFVANAYGRAELDAPLGKATIELLGDGSERGTPAPWERASWYVVHSLTGTPIGRLDQSMFQTVLLDILGMAD
jgi:hypothetical protein